MWTRFVSIAITLILSTASTSIAEAGVDWARTIKLLKDLKDQAQKYQKAFDYALGVADDVKNDRKVRTPPVFRLKGDDSKLKAMLKGLEQVTPPPLPEDSGVDLKTKASAGTPGRNKKRAEKLIAFQKILKAHVEQVESATVDLCDIADAAIRAEKAGRKLRDTFSSLHDNGAVRAFFKDAFGFAALDLEAIIIPQIAEIKSEASSKARTFGEIARDRRKRLKTYTDNVRDLLPALGIAVPSDLR